MAWADCLAGLCIANAGVTLPHGIGMTIGGYCPYVMHGEALAVTYPEFTRFTYPSRGEVRHRGPHFCSPAQGRVRGRGRSGFLCLLDEFQQEIGMWLSLEGLNVSQKRSF